VAAVGEQEAGAHGRPLLLVLRVRSGLKGRVLVKESLDATRASVPVKQQSKEDKKKNQDGCKIG
jgi:hypothetical protein